MFKQTFKKFKGSDELTIGERLRLARERNGYTQVFVRDRTGINNKTLSGYENGVSEPDMQTLSILADTYSVTVDWLFGRVNKEWTKDWTANDEKILQDINKLNPSDRDYIIGFIERLKKSSQL